MAMDVVGCTERGIIAKSKAESPSSEEGYTEVRVTDVKSSGLERIWSLRLNHENEKASDISHATVQKLRNEVPENLAEASSWWLVGLVKQRRKGNGAEEQEKEYMGELLLVQLKEGALDCMILDRTVVVQWQEFPLQMHLISSLTIEAALMDDSLNRQCVQNGLIVLFLSKCKFTQKVLWIHFNRTVRYDLFLQYLYRCNDV